MYSISDEYVKAFQMVVLYVISQDCRCHAKKKVGRPSIKASAIICKYQASVLSSLDYLLTFKTVVTSMRKTQSQT